MPSDSAGSVVGSSSTTVGVWVYVLVVIIVLIIIIAIIVIIVLLIRKKKRRDYLDEDSSILDMAEIKSQVSLENATRASSSTNAPAPTPVVVKTEEPTKEPHEQTAATTSEQS